MVKDSPTRSLVCASCGAPLAVDRSAPPSIFTCGHCGTVQQIIPDPSSAPSDRCGDACARRGIEAYQRGDYHFALKELEEALTLPLKRYQSTELLTILGNACDHLNRYPQAIAFYQRALDQDPAYYKAWVALGVTYRHKGNLGEAERCYRAALAIEPEYAELHASLGALSIHRGDAPAAVESLEKAVRLNPSLAVAHGNIALAYAMARRFEDADRSLRQAVLLGYKEYETIRARIAALKSLG